MRPIKILLLLLFILLKILLLFILFFIVLRIRKSIIVKHEKIEELDGEYIFTYFKNGKKEIYFNIKEIDKIFFSSLVVNDSTLQKITLIIILKDGYRIKLRKNENIIIFLRSCIKNKEELYNKFLSEIPMGLDISKIIEEEIKKYEEKNK